jgi:lactate 2-monooxygenase
MRLRLDGEPLGGIPRPGLGAISSLLEFLSARARWSPPGVSARQTLDAVRRFLAIYTRNDLTWPDLQFLRSRTRLPLLLKGILNPDDAKRAIEAGMDGISVSNHGGCQVDGAVPALEQLASVADAVGAKVPVLFDRGIRTGADRQRHRSPRARRVDRPPLRLRPALAGELGVRTVIDNLVAELDLTIGLSERRSLGELDRSAIKFGPA